MIEYTSTSHSTISGLLYHHSASLEYMTYGHEVEVDIEVEIEVKTVDEIRTIKHCFPNT